MLEYPRNLEGPLKDQVQELFDYIWHLIEEVNTLEGRLQKAEEKLK